MSRAPATPPPGSFAGRLELRTPPGLPELRLWLIADGFDLEAACAELGDGEAPPYWAFCWGSGQALARWLLDEPTRVRGRRCVDFGSGSGVVALAAARAGAASVVAVDIDPVARRSIAANASANDLDVATAWEVPDDFDVLLAADVFYEAPLRDKVVGYAGSGRVVWIADPLRTSAPRLPVDPVAVVAARTFPDVDSPHATAAIYVLRS